VVKAFELAIMLQFLTRFAQEEKVILRLLMLMLTKLRKNSIEIGNHFGRSAQNNLGMAKVSERQK
jgi:hypothetical protein